MENSQAWFMAFECRAYSKWFIAERELPACTMLGNWMSRVGSGPVSPHSLVLRGYFLCCN